MKTCNKCKTEKDMKSFYVNKRMKDGLNTFCIDCHKADNILRKALKRKIPEFILKEFEYKKQYRLDNNEKHKEYMKIWHEKNASKQIEYRKAYRESNKAYFKQYNELNKHLISARTRKRQAAKISRTPKWIDKEELWLIENAYELALTRTKLTGLKWHVDHIIPLQGNKVSGLHVFSNIQVILAKDNLAKANRFEV